MKRVWYAAVSIAAGLAIAEVIMQPTMTERLELATIFIAMGGLMTISAKWLPYWAKRNRSLRATITVISLLAISIVALGLVVVANRMFLSAHDLTITLVVLAFGSISAVGLAIAVGRTLAADIERLSKIAEDVSAGDLNEPTAISRRDEVGRLSRSLDLMVEQLRQADEARIADAASRSWFFSAVGHDLRTPLSSMRAAIEAIRDGVVEDTDRYLASMERDVAALSSLVDDIFLLAQLDSGAYVTDLTATDVTEVADEAMDVLTPLANDRGVTLRLQSPGRVHAIASPGPLARAMRNLLDNAIRHAPEGSIVTVEVSNGSGDVLIRVIDEGTGFETDFIPIAFDRFTRADSARARDGAGSGLGLAIAGELVTALDGHIWAEPGPGGRVSLELPANV